MASMVAGPQDVVQVDSLQVIVNHLKKLVTLATCTHNANFFQNIGFKELVTFAICTHGADVSQSVGFEKFLALATHM